MNDAFYVAGIDFSLAKVDVIVTKHETKEKILLIVAKENHKFDILAGRDNLMLEIENYFTNLPSKIRSYLPVGSEINYAFRVASAGFEIGGSQIKWSEKDRIDENVLNIYQQFLGIIKLIFLKKQISVNYYSSRFVSFFFYRELKYSVAALRLAMYTQFTKGFTQSGQTMAYAIALIESLRIKILYKRGIHLAFTTDQTKLMKLYLEKERIPEDYVFAFNKIEE